MCFGAVAPKVHVRPHGCERKSGINNVHYTSRENVTYTYVADANGLNDKARISLITSPSVGNGFFELAPFKRVSDAKPTNTFEKASEGGESTTTQELVLQINEDTPEIRAVLDDIYQKSVDLLVEYNEDGYKYEIQQGMILINIKRENNRRNVLTFKAENPDMEATLVYDTDEATTEAMIATVIEPYA